MIEYLLVCLSFRMSHHLYKANNSPYNVENLIRNLLKILLDPTGVLAFKLAKLSSNGMLLYFSFFVTLLLKLPMCFVKEKNRVLFLALSCRGGGRADSFGGGRVEVEAATRSCLGALDRQPPWCPLPASQA